MTKTSKTVLGIIVLIIIIVGIAVWHSKKSNAPVAATTGTDTSVPAGTDTTAPASAPASPSASVTDTSDASIDQDTAAIDTQMTTLNSDSANTTPNEQ